jgi:sRNA-binding protein
MMNNDLLSTFVEKYPQAFIPRGQACKPLKIGIHKDITGPSNTHA